MSWRINDTLVVIETAGLTRRFGAKVAVDGLDLTVRQGEILGVVGPDGAGKTTTLRLLAAVMKPSAGRVRVFGHDTVRGASQVKRRIGYVAQRFSLYDDLTVVENVEFYADLFGVPRAERQRRMERLLTMARLGEFRRRRAGRLSGGMKRKLALACILVHTPDLILLDEPTTGVDPVSRREFWDILVELHLQGITLVITTPYMDEAELSTRVGLMIEGRMAVCDTPANIRAMMQGEIVSLWPTDVRQAQSALAGAPGLGQVQMFGDQLRIRVQDSDAAIPRIRAHMEAHGIGVRDLRRARPRLEEVFISLMEGQTDVRSSEEV